MKITDEMIRSYCDRMGYKLLAIGKIAFEYLKPNGEKSALLKAAAAHKTEYATGKRPAVKSARCATCGSPVDTIGGQPLQGWCRQCGRWRDFVCNVENEGGNKS